MAQIVEGKDAIPMDEVLQKIKLLGSRWPIFRDLAKEIGTVFEQCGSEIERLQGIVDFEGDKKSEFEDLQQNHHSLVSLICDVARGIRTFDDLAVALVDQAGDEARGAFA